MNDPSSTLPSDSDGSQHALFQTYPQANDPQAIQKLLQATLDVSMDMIQVFKAVRNQHGEIVDFTWILNNHASEKIYGDVVGKNLLERQPGVVEEGIFATFKQVVETGEPQQYEKHYVHEQFDGWFHQSVVKLNDGVATTTADITGRKKAEQELQEQAHFIHSENEEKYRTLFESFDHAFCILELVYNDQGIPVDFRWLEANPAYGKQTGLLEVTGKLASEVIPGTEPSWFAMWDQVSKTGEPLSYENWHQDTGRWYESSISRIGGAHSRRLAVIGTDITERKQQEQEQAFLLTLGDTLRPLRDPVTIEGVVTQLLRKHVEVGWCYYVAWDEVNKLGLVRRDATRKGLASLVGEHDVSDVGEFLELLKANPLLAVSDYETYERLTPALRHRYTSLGFRSMLVATLVKQDRLVASLLIGDTKIRHWSTHEAALLMQVAERTWAAVERARAEETLKQREAELARVQEIGLIGGVDIDVANQLSGKRSPEYLRLHGLPADTQSETHQDWLHRLHPDDRGQAEQTLLTALQGTQASYESEYRIIRPNDGQVVWIYAKLAIERNAAGKPVRLVGVHIDITRRKRAEGALQQLEQRNRLAIEAAELATWEWDLVTDQVYWNEQHFHLLGMPVQPNPLPAEAFMRHLHPDDAESIKDQLRAAIRQRSLYDAQFRIVREDGVVRWMSGYGRVVAEQDHQPVRVSGVMVDITERKEVQQALQHSEARQRAILESTKDYAIFTTDLARRVTSWNQGAQAVFGYSEEQILHRPADVLFTPEDRQQGAPEAEAKKALSQGRAENERWHSRPDGSRLYGSGMVTPLRDETGAIVGLLKVVRDLTAQKRAEEALQQADRRKDEFLAMLAHELRNPMSTIRSGLHVLTLTDGKDETSRQTVDMMNRQTDHLVRMVDELLDVSRISQGKIELHKERVNLVELVSQAVESVQALYQEQGKRLAVNLPAAPIYLEGDATRLTQVVTNLLTNGARYTGEQGRVWLRLEHQNAQQEAILQVGDNGIGLAADQLGAIFELFVQVDNSTARAKGGLGLGLTLVKRLVELHGGQVEAQSEGLGQGSRFTVHLPTLTAAAESSAKATPQPTDLATAGRILVIDDNADAGFTLAMLLKLKGYETHSRISGQAGIKAAEQLQPAAILLDIGMPEMDGYTTCRLIREQAWGGDMVVIALTGYGQEEDRQRTSEAGFDGHLVKPVDLTTLTKLLTDLLDQHKKLSG